MSPEDWWVMWDAYVTGHHEYVHSVMPYDFATLPRKFQHAPELLGFLRAVHPLQSVPAESRTVRIFVRKAWGVIHYSPRPLIPGFPTRSACRLLISDPSRIVHTRGVASCSNCQNQEPRGNRITTVGHQ